jgi:hypothetical protein
MYWCLYAIDRELIFPKVMDQVIPWWYNQSVHVNVILIMLAETVMTPRRNSTSRRLELTLTSIVYAVYTIV